MKYKYPLHIILLSNIIHCTWVVGGHSSSLGEGEVGGGSCNTNYIYLGKESQTYFACHSWLLAAPIL